MPVSIQTIRRGGPVKSTMMNVDIGGGTCKLAIAKNGAILETAAINVGSRLVAWDARGHWCSVDFIHLMFLGRNIQSEVTGTPSLTPG